MRGLRWEAGYAVDAGLTVGEAVKAVTYNIAKAYGVDTLIGSITPGQAAVMIGYSGNPVTLESNLEFVATNDHFQCRPMPD